MSQGNSTSLNSRCLINLHTLFLANLSETVWTALWTRDFEVASDRCFEYIFGVCKNTKSQAFRVSLFFFFCLSVSLSLTPALTGLASASDSFWRYPRNPEVTNEGRLSAEFSSLDRGLQVSGKSFGTSSKRFQMIDNEQPRTIGEGVHSLDVSGFAGYDFLVTEGYPRAEVPKDASRYQQLYVHIPSDETSDLPEFFRNPKDRVNAQFWEIFPPFKLPAGKLLQFNSGFLDETTQKGADLRRFGFTGVSARGGASYADGDVFDFDYDYWAIEAFVEDFTAEEKKKSPGLTTIEYRKRALQAIKDNPKLPAAWFELAGSSSPSSFSRLQSAFLSALFWVKEKGSVVLDFEFFNAQLTEKGWAILADLFEEFHRAFPNAKIAVWAFKPYMPFYEEGTPSTDDEKKRQLEIAASLGRDVYRSIPELVQGKRVPHWILSPAKKILSEVDSIEASGYSLTPTQNSVYHLVHQIEVVRHILQSSEETKSQKIIPVFWHWVELLPNESDWHFQFHRFPRFDSPATYRSVAMKPLVAPSMMHGVAAWSLFLGDGLTLWNDPWIMQEDERFIAMSESPETYAYHFGADNSIFPAHSTRGIDWAVLAAYQLSRQGDLLSSSAPIESPEVSLDGGVSWLKGDDLLAPVAAAKTLPVVRLKKSEDGNAWLVIASDRLGPLKKRTFQIKSGGRVAEMQTKGYFTTIARIDRKCADPSELKGGKCFQPENSEDALGATMNVFPSPLVDGKGQLEIYATGSSEKENQKVILSITDASGREVFARREITLGNTIYRESLDFSKLPEGIYQVSILSWRGKITKRVVR
jgi:hypothetical protein